MILITAIIVSLPLLVLTASFICYRMVFYSPSRKPLGENEYDLPDDDIYKPYHEKMIKWIKDIRNLNGEDIEITSRDGLTLRGKFYEYKKGAPVEIMLHGYKGNAERDLCGGVQRAFALGRSTILVNQRASGPSDGSTITFGIKERFDAVDWVKYARERFGSETPLFLTGVSMGAATVMMAAASPELPENLVFILADCGYSTARDIIQKTVREMKLPSKLIYPFIKLGGRIFGKFNVDEFSPLEAVKNARVPIIFIHGDSDDFIPYSMSEKLFEVCKTKKELIPIKGAGHGLAFPSSEEEYVEALRKFESSL